MDLTWRTPNISYIYNRVASTSTLDTWISNNAISHMNNRILANIGYPSYTVPEQSPSVLFSNFDIYSDLDYYSDLSENSIIHVNNGISISAFTGVKIGTISTTKMKPCSGGITSNLTVTKQEEVTD